MSKQEEKMPRYMMIALDIAYRIERQEFVEGQKLRGRSLLSSEYSVSPETIRRAARLLEEMHVLEIIDKSGIIIKSKEKATLFIKQVKGKNSLYSTTDTLNQLMSERKKINQEIDDKVMELIDLTTKVKNTNHFVHHEVTVPPCSLLHQKSIKDIQFWKFTHATIIGVQRNDQLYVSPGPDFQFLEEDQISFVCSPENLVGTTNFIQLINSDS